MKNVFRAQLLMLVCSNSTMNVNYSWFVIDGKSCYLVMSEAFGSLPSQLQLFKSFKDFFNKTRRLFVLTKLRDFVPLLYRIYLINASISLKRTDGVSFTKVSCVYSPRPGGTNY